MQKINLNPIPLDRIKARIASYKIITPSLWIVFYCLMIVSSVLILKLYGFTVLLAYQSFIILILICSDRIIAAIEIVRYELREKK